MITVLVPHWYREHMGLSSVITVQCCTNWAIKSPGFTAQLVHVQHCTGNDMGLNLIQANFFSDFLSPYSPCWFTACFHSHQIPTKSPTTQAIKRREEIVWYMIFSCYNWIIMTPNNWNVYYSKEWNRTSPASSFLFALLIFSCKFK